MLNIAVLALFDHRTGIEYRLFPLYYLPVALVAWHVGRIAGLLMAAFAVAAWMLANMLAGERFASAWVWIVNGVMQAISAATVALLIAELRRRLAAERGRSGRDALTGLTNRRGFEELAQPLLAGAARRGEPVALAYLDIDDFKPINDLFGHAEGDRVLQAVAEALAASARDSDLCGRLGGDEFFVLLPGADAAGARAFADRLQAEVGRVRCRDGHPVGVSIGVATSPTAQVDIDELLVAADKAMYVAKGAGKRQTHIVALVPEAAAVSGRAAGPSRPAAPAARSLSD